MEYITLALFYLIIFLNYGAGIACVYMRYWLAFKNENKLHPLLGASKFFFYVFAFIEFVFFSYSIYTLPYLINYNEGFGPEFALIMIFPIIGFLHAVYLVLLTPWYYYQKNLPFAEDHKTLLNRSFSIFAKLLLFMMLVSISIYSLRKLQNVEHIVNEARHFNK